jgi:hypothetical protein
MRELSLTSFVVAVRPPPQPLEPVPTITENEMGRREDERGWD